VKEEGEAVMKSWTVDDVMTRAVVSVGEAAGYRAVVDLLIGRCISAVPVVDAFQRVTGVVSEADLLSKIEYAGDEAPRLFEGRRRRGERGKALAGTASELMSTPAVTVLARTSIADAARLMDDENVKRLPVVDDLGRLVGIVARRDLLKVHLRPDLDIRDEVEAVVRDEEVTAEVSGGVATLQGHVAVASIAEELARLTRRVPGVVQVVDHIRYDHDDRAIIATELAYGAG
jgi:CBS domain-containing protein